MNPNEYGQSLTIDEPEPAQAYRIIWMGKDGEYDQRQFPLNEVVIGTQDNSFMVATPDVNPTILLLIPVQRIVQVELVKA